MRRMAPFQRFGIRTNSDHRKGFLPWAEREEVHVAVNDATSLACIEVLYAEQKATTVGFLVRAVSGFNSENITCSRVLSYNGSGYRLRQ